MTKRNPKTAEDIMTRRVRTLSPDAPVLDAAHALMRLRYSGAPVTDAAGKVLGVFSEQDLVRVLTHAVYERWPGGTVADHMTKEVDRVAPGDDIASIAAHFTEGGRRRLPVMDGEQLVGIISRRDLIRALDRMLAPERPPTVYEIFHERR